jgi:dTMP kinase
VIVSEVANNFFLVIEGLDGSGKSEISRRLKQTLQTAHGPDVELTFEPHDPSAAGLFIRQVLTKQIETKDRTLALAFALNRADHNDRIINPFLDAGQQRILICDRYYLSSLVYQSTHEIPMEQVMMLNAGARQPDLIIFLNASAATCYERMNKRPQDRELFERNLEASRQKYLQAIDFLRARGETIVEVNADGDRQTVFNALLEALTKHGPSWLKAHPIT